MDIVHPSAEAAKLINGWDLQTIISLGALVVSAVVGAVTVWSGYETRKRQRLSVRPICIIRTEETPTKLLIVVRNIGVGPMLITYIGILDKKAIAYSGFSSILSDMNLPIATTSFGDLTDGMPVESNGEELLLSYEGKADDRAYQLKRNAVAERLSTFSIHVDFTDIYGRKMPKKVVPVKLDPIVIPTNSGNGKPA